MIKLGDLSEVNDKKIVLPQSGKVIEQLGAGKFNFSPEQKLEEVNTVKDVIDNLDKDEVDVNTNLTSIDFNTRLTNSEITSIVALQMLHTLQVGGSAVSLITRSIKRHKVSLGGEGRREKVQIVQGERDHDEGRKNTNSIFGKLRGVMGGNNEQR